MAKKVSAKKAAKAVKPPVANVTHLEAPAVAPSQVHEVPCGVPHDQNWQS